MERHVTSSSSDMKPVTTSHPTDYNFSQPAAHYMDTDIIPSTVDSSSLSHNNFSQMSFSSFPHSVPGAMSGHTPVKGGKGKGIKKVKKVKVEDEDGDEEIDIDKYVQEDSARISVKILRKIIPKLRIACYFSDEQVSGKRKLKHLWDERPADWPNTVSFKDPNNALKDTRKPGKDELSPMYDFLKRKYLEIKNFPRGRQEIQHQMSYSSPVMSENTTGHQPLYQVVIQPNGGTTCHPSDDDPVVYQLPSSVKTATEDSKWYLENQQDPYWQMQQQQNVVHPTEDQAVLAPTRPEHLPRVMQQNMATMVTGQEPMMNGRSLGTSDVPAPVSDLYQRLQDKQRQVAAISKNSMEVVKLLNSVQNEVISSLYSKLSLSETRMCLMFLDAGHQYEALLDVIVVLGQMDLSLLNNGCQEIINKFNKECTPVLMIPGVVQLRLPSKTCGMAGQKSVFDSSLKRQLYGEELGSEDSLIKGDDKHGIKSDDLKHALQYIDMANMDVTSDISTFGISQRHVQGQGLDNLGFIEKRTPAMQTEQDVEKKQIDDMADYYKPPQMDVYLTEQSMPTFADVAKTNDNFDKSVDGPGLSSHDILLSSTDKPPSDHEADNDISAMECELLLEDVCAVISNDSPQAQSWQTDVSQSWSLSSSQTTESPSLPDNNHDMWSLVTQPSQTASWNGTDTSASQSSWLPSAQWQLTSETMQSGMSSYMPNQYTDSSLGGTMMNHLFCQANSDNSWSTNVDRASPLSSSQTSQTFESSQRPWSVASTDTSLPGTSGFEQELSWSPASQSVDLLSGAMRSCELLPAEANTDSQMTGVLAPTQLSASGPVGNWNTSSVQNSQFVPSASARNVPPIPSFVSSARFEDFEEDQGPAGNGRRHRQSRGSTSSSRSNKGFDRNTRRT